MIGKLRRVVALCGVLLAYMVFLPLQLVAMKTGWYSESIFRQALHWANVKALGIRIHRSGAMTDKRPLLVVSNHISWTDISVLGSQQDIAFIAKSEVAGWPLIGWFAKLQRCVFVDRQSRRKSGEQATEIATRLAAGHAVGLFAEGSTGDGNMLLPFKSTLFGAATKAISDGSVASVYIQPVAVAYTRLHGVPMGRRHRPNAAWIGDQDLVPDAMSRLREGGMDVEVHFGAPIEFSAGMDRKRVSREVEQRVGEMMQAALRAPRPSA